MEERVSLVRVTNPFDITGSRIITPAVWAPGKTVRDFAREHLPGAVGDGLKLVASVNGLPLADAEWDTHCPRPGDQILFHASIEGGGGGGGKNILRVVAMLAVILVAPWAGTQFAGMYGGWAANGPLAMTSGGVMNTVSTIGSVGFTLGGMAAINALIPPALPGVDTADGPEYSTAYRFGPSSNRAVEGGPAPVLFGRSRVWPVEVGRYVKFDEGSDEERLYWLGFICEGDYKDSSDTVRKSINQITDIEVNEVSAADYEGVTTLVRTGDITPSSPVPGFSNSVVDHWVGAQLESSNNPASPIWSDIITTGSDTEELAVVIEFPLGLGYYDVDGNDTHRNQLTRHFALQYRLNGTSTWLTDATGHNTTLEGVPCASVTKFIEKPYQVYLSVKSNLSPGSYQVRVSQLDACVPSNPQYLDRSVFKYVEATAYAEYLYPCAALLGVLSVSSSQTSSQQRYSAIGDRHYVPVWNGAAYELRPSSNPAWAAYEVLHNPVYGMSVSRDDIIYADFLDWAEWCGEASVDEALFTGTGLNDLVSGCRTTEPAIPEAKWSWFSGPEDMTYRVQIEAAGATDTVKVSKDGGATWFITNSVITGTPQHIEYGVYGTFGATTGHTEGDYWDIVCYQSSAGAHVPKLEFNFYADAIANGPRMLQYIEAAGRAKVIQRGTRWGAIVFKPAVEPLGMKYSEGNIAPDSFEETFLAIEDRANILEVTFWDRERNYERRTIVVKRDDYYTSGEEERKASVTLYGVVGVDQAASYAHHLLLRNQYILRTISFMVDVDALASEVGDPIYFQRSWLDWGQFRKAGIGSTTAFVRVAESITLETGYTYGLLVRHLDTDVIEHRQINVALPFIGTDLVVNSLLSSAPAEGAHISIGRYNLEAKKFRITGISRRKDQIRQVTAEEYYDELFDDTAPTYTFTSELAEYPLCENLTVSQTLDSTGRYAYANLTWKGANPAAGNKRAWYVYWRIPSQSTKWNLAPQKLSNSPGYVFRDVVVGVEYEFAVSPVANPTSDWADSATYTFVSPLDFWDAVRWSVYLDDQGQGGYYTGDFVEDSNNGTPGSENGSIYFGTGFTFTHPFSGYSKVTATPAYCKSPCNDTYGYRGNLCLAFVGSDRTRFSPESDFVVVGKYNTAWKYWSSTTNAWVSYTQSANDCMVATLTRGTTIPGGITQFARLAQTLLQMAALPTNLPITPDGVTCGGTWPPGFVNNSIDGTAGSNAAEVYCGSGTFTHPKSVDGGGNFKTWSTDAARKYATSCFEPGPPGNNEVGRAWVAFTGSDKTRYALIDGVKPDFLIVRQNYNSTSDTWVWQYSTNTGWSDFTGAGFPVADDCVVAWVYRKDTSSAGFDSLVSLLSSPQVTEASINFDARNDRNATAITAPTIAADGTAVDHTVATDSTANISLEWSWAGTEADIDGFILYVRQSTSATSYDFGTTPAEERVITCPADKRAYILYGVPVDQYYTFGVRAYRVVDPDVNAAGIITTAVVQPALAAEDPYRPSATVGYAGDVTGTVAGTAASTVRDNASTGAGHAGTGGNPHGATLDQISGDLDDIDNGATYFRTTADQVTGAGRAYSALDSNADYIRVLYSTKIVVSAVNPDTGVVFDDDGIRMYQGGGDPKVNIPVTGNPYFAGELGAATGTFAGNMTAGGSVDVTGYVKATAAHQEGTYYASIYGFPSTAASIGVYGRSSGGSYSYPGVFGHNTHATAGLGVKGLGATGVQGEGFGGAGYGGVVGLSTNAAGYGVIAQNTGGGSALKSEGKFYCTGQIESTVTGNLDGTGNPPFIVASSKVVGQLNANYLQGNLASAFATSSHNHDSTYAPITHYQSAATISTGNLNIAQLPTSGTWSPTGDLAISTASSIYLGGTDLASSGLVVGPADNVQITNYLGVGTGPDTNVRMRVAGSVWPHAANTYDLGKDSALYWKSLWALTVNYDVLTDWSDERSKEDIVDCLYGLREIMAIQPISFRRKTIDEPEETRLVVKKRPKQQQVKAFAPRIELLDGKYVQTGINLVSALGPVVEEVPLYDQAGGVVGTHLVTVEEEYEEVEVVKPAHRRIDHRVRQGFSAQQVAQAWASLGHDPRDFCGVEYDADNDRWTTQKLEFLPVMIRAIQEQQELIQVMAAEIEQLKKKLQ